MKPKVYTLKDIDFKPHPLVKGAVQGLLYLPNGITVSIVGGGMGRLYGDGVDTFEVAAWKTNTNEWITLGDGEDILAYVPKDKIPFIIFDLLKK